MQITLLDYQKVRKFLDGKGIDSILYGSLGASVYLGRYKNFNDIDLLIDRKYIENEWENLVQIMKSNGFDISDEKEHEFTDKDGLKVAFAGQDVLTRDEICNPGIGVVEIEIDGIQVRTLAKSGFINAYTFSATDGYRREKRGQNDLAVVEALKKVKPDA